MILSTSLLSVITFLPLIGALFLLFVTGRDEASESLVRWIALVVSTATFVLSLLLWAWFDPSQSGFQFVENYEWIGNSIGYRMGVDGISVLFVVLTALLMPICVIASWTSVHSRVREYMIVFLVLETLMIGAFATLDLAMFYVFFEGTLIPMFLIIGIWGGARRIQASYKFFFYTFTGSVLMLLAIMAMYWQGGTTDIAKLLQVKFPPGMQIWLWLALLRLLCGEDADVAVPPLAAGSARRGADGRLGDPGGDPAEVRRVRLPPLLAADVPGRIAPVRELRLRAFRRRHHPHLAGRAGAGPT